MMSDDISWHTPPTSPPLHVPLTLFSERNSSMGNTTFGHTPHFRFRSMYSWLYRVYLCHNFNQLRSQERFTFTNIRTWTEPRKHRSCSISSVDSLVVYKKWVGYSCLLAVPEVLWTPGMFGLSIHFIARYCSHLRIHVNFLAGLIWCQPKKLWAQYYYERQ